jgi:hypothetical protein
MKVNLKVGTLAAAAGALVVAVPAVAHPSPSTHSSQANHPARSHRCLPHKVAYVEGGTVDGTTPSTLAKNLDGTWSGDLYVDVVRANHHAKGDKMTVVKVSFDNAKLQVHFRGGAAGFTKGERVQLVGKLAVVAKRCPALSPAATPVFRMITVHPAPKPPASTPAQT